MKGNLLDLKSQELCISQPIHLTFYLRKELGKNFKKTLIILRYCLKKLENKELKEKIIYEIYFNLFFRKK
jgi:hypothetical protein